MPEMKSANSMDAVEHAEEAAVVSELSKVAEKMGVKETPSDVSADDITQLPKYWLPENAYLALKWIALVMLPLIAIAYPTIANIWGWPVGTQVSETCNVVALAIGVTIGASQLKASIGGSNA